MNEPTLKDECEALAKIIAQQPHAQQLKEYFDLCFKEERSQVLFVELRQRKIKLLSDCPRMSEA